MALHEIHTTPARRLLAELGLLAGLLVMVAVWAGTPAPARANDLPPSASPLVTQLAEIERLRTLSQDARAYARALRTRDAVAEESWSTRSEALDRYRDAAQADRTGDAIAALHDYIDAGGDDDPDRWRALASLHLRQDGRSREGVLAAWTAYAVAGRDSERAQALMMLGRVAETVADRDLAVPFLQAAIAYGAGQEARERLAAQTPDAPVTTAVVGRIEQDVPELCVTFTADPVTDGSVRYEDFVALAPADDVVARVDADALCLSGFRHGADLDVTLRRGLPLAGGAALADSRTWTVAIPDRAPRVAFVGEGHVLPARGSQGLPLDSVNVERVDLEIYRLPARGLAAALRDGDVFRPLPGWSADALRQETGTLVWSGSMDLPHEPNRQRRSAVPFAEAVPNPEPGLYAVTATLSARETPNWWDRPTQWVLVTDIGLQAYHGARDLVIAARSLETAQPLPGVDVALIARNNDVLGTATTDADGLARLPATLLAGDGGARPSHLTATAPEGTDQAMLDLGRPALDLSDRGIGGRQVPGPLDAFLYLERGIYRPGETIEVMALLRDDRARAVTGLPLTLKVMRPDGVEVRREVVTPDSGGGAGAQIPTADADRTGAWTITAHADPDGPAIGQVSVQLEDFVPARMEVLLDAPEAAVLRPDAPPVTVGVEARYLYGAPAADLAAEAELILRHDPRPFGEARADYTFGLTTETFEAWRTDLTIPDTDAEGRTRVEAMLPEAPDTTLPLSALVRATVLEPGGQATNRAVSLPVRLTDSLVGLDPLFEGGRVDEAGEARYRVLAVDASGAPLPGRTLRVIHYAEDWDYQWYQESDGWRYRAVVRDRRLDARDVTTGPDGTAEVVLPVPDWGRYRIEVADMGSGAVSSDRFRAGWRVPGPSAQDTPDTLRMTAEADTYAVGETARVSLDPPFAGEALVTVLGQDVLDVRTVSVPDEGLVVEVPVTGDWGAGAYVTVSLFRPGTDAERGPGRAVGVQWIAVDTADRTLSVTLDTPETMRPRSPLTIPVSVANAGPDTRVTVAVVDEGILQLTGFATPKPDTYFLGKRRLGVDLRDAYGALIDGRDATFGRLRTGGDAAGRHAPGLPDKTVEPLAFFSGPVALDADGTATVSVDIPAFNGRVRVMAAAYDAAGVGHGEAEVTIRDPMVTLVTLPRFLAPEDRAAMHVTLDNVDGPAGDWRVSVTARGGVAVASNGAATLTIPEDGRATHVATLRGAAIGGGGVTLTVTDPEGATTTQSWGLSTRPAATRETRAVATRLEPGQSTPVDPGVLDGFTPDTASVTLSLSTLPDLGLVALLRDLDRYPYGCVEQTVSRALPLLALADVAAAAGVLDPDDPDARARRIDGAISRVIAMQRGDGGFSLWGGSERQEWLSAYATEFLVRARDAGHRVPPFALERALGFLEDTVIGLDYPDEALPARAYALYVLALAGAADPGALRYVHDADLVRMPAPLPRAHLGAALAMIGDTARARSAFEAAVSPSVRLSSLTDGGDETRRAPYGSALSDLATTVALMAEAGLGDALAEAEDLAGERAGRRWLSTQEQARLVQAAAALRDLQGPLSVSVSGAPLIPAGEGFALVRPLLDQVAAGLSVTNTGAGTVTLVTTGDGIPTQPPGALENGLSITRAFYTLEGRRVDPGMVDQSDLMVALISAEAVDPMALGNDDTHHALVVDLLPAGLVLENAAIGDGRSTAGLDWLPELDTPDHVELRDDRFVASIPIDRQDPAFTLAYMVRAVTPGVFTMPGVFVESMYRPALRARGPAGQMIIAPR
ncbi:alpha-2-macroglobulin family protein [Roseospira navarrensis]|uniref:Alpha-2-macroglobulin family protein n=1 Tax=Roseospira navarrensis TaxID=140058 RepID=A0A7X1ZBU3_9PROT|nr:alpha-2-macroglobulin [Roseospira navarrensis]MQX35675.1 alpha-2-macroglobulin family protein [Roseospira navarrensis]